MIVYVQLHRGLKILVCVLMKDILQQNAFRSLFKEIVLVLGVRQHQ